MQLTDLNTPQRVVRFDRERLQLRDIVDIARGTAHPELSNDPAFRAAIAKGADFLDRLLREDGAIYGVTTGYGDSCTVAVPLSLVSELPHHLYTYHGCGLGAHLTPAQTRAVMGARLASLSKGFSGVSVGLLEQIVRLFDAGLLPLIPSEGSVGASGDLTPLSYLAAVLCGEREVLRDGVQVPAGQALKEAGITPLRLRPKEGLAIMNGTAVMTGLACLAWDRADYLARLTTRITALASFALDGNDHHFDETLFSVKPHAGMQNVAAWLREDLEYTGQLERNGKRLQDRYSIRCAPHVIGVLTDALPFFKGAIENELNSANDNPIIDAEGERVLHGGHFYGGHIAFAMDSLKNLVANVADLLDRQLAWTAEALKLTMPASVFSRSTECHNQDKVSMGTIAARDCLRVLELTEQVAAALLITVRQGVWLRTKLDTSRALPAPLVRMMDLLGQDIAPVVEDRRLDPELHLLLGRIRDQAWSLYA